MELKINLTKMSINEIAAAVAPFGGTVTVITGGESYTVAVPEKK
jgi:hypothetical protein